MTPLFFMMRHGTTTLNINNCYRGWSDGPDAQLDSLGCSMARSGALALLSLPSLPAAGKDNSLPVLESPITHIIHSPLGRAAQTATIAAKILGVCSDNITASPELVPLNVGDYTGKNKSAYPLDEYIKNPTVTIPGGESLNDFMQRQFSFFHSFLGDIGSQNKGLCTGQVLIVAHVSNMMFLWESCQKTPVKDLTFLSEKSDVVLPGGLMVADTDMNAFPFWRINLDAIPEDEREAAREMCMRTLTADEMVRVVSGAMSSL